MKITGKREPEFSPVTLTLRFDREEEFEIFRSTLKRAQWNPPDEVIEDIICTLDNMRHWK